MTSTSFRDQIFITIQEQKRISDILNTFNNQNDFNTNVRIYLSYQAQFFLTRYYPRFSIKSYEVYTFPYLPKWYFYLLITNPNTNHPFLLFTNLDDNKIWVIRPIGKDRGQVEINVFNNAITQCTNIERFAILFFIDRSILVRKTALLYIPQFTLIKCSNIANCVKKMHEINKMKISKTEKTKLIEKYEAFYKEKALEFLQQYFYLLGIEEYEEAFMFLKGDNGGRYFKKERLNTFFRDTKTIIGHLQIFIELYKLLNYVKLFVTNLK